MRFQFVEKHRMTWQAKRMYETLGVSRAGYYEWPRRPLSARARRTRATTPNPPLSSRPLSATTAST